jgi:lysophospholipase L1-like esterase
MIRFKTILIVAAWITATSCQATEEEIPVMQNSHQTQNESTGGKRYLALGDSYTIGEAVPSSERFPLQLKQKLSTEGIDLSAPEIIARTGWTTDELMKAISDEKPSGPFDLVTLLIGVNNQYRGRDTAEYRLQFRELLETAIGYAGADATRIMVISIPDYGFTPFAINRDRERISSAIDIFNQINLQETRKTRAAYIDITGISRKGLDEPYLIAPDGLHPSGVMYHRWTELMLPMALKILRGQ